MVDASGKVFKSIGNCHIGFSNNQCECYAVLEALRYVNENKWVRALGDYVCIRSDSKLVVNYLNRVWRVREPGLA